MSVGLPHFLILSVALFCLGLYGIVTRRNAVMVLMGIELVLNSANINFLAFTKYGGITIAGQAVAIFVIILAACEAAVALAIILNIYKQFNTVNVDEIDTLRD
jgi:NADH-quinone oxidoreductase subunit K